VTSVNASIRTGRTTSARAYASGVSDAEHELLQDNIERVEEIARLRALAVRAARAAIDAQERADGQHDAWLDAVVDESHSAANR
jgi:hypothetical protein